MLAPLLINLSIGVIFIMLSYLKILVHRFVLVVHAKEKRCRNFGWLIFHVVFGWLVLTLSFLVELVLIQEYLWRPESKLQLKEQQDQKPVYHHDMMHFLDWCFTLPQDERAPSIETSKMIRNLQNKWQIHKLLIAVLYSGSEYSSME